MEARSRGFEVAGRIRVEYQFDDDVWCRYLPGVQNEWHDIGFIPEEVQAAGQEAMQSWVDAAVTADLRERIARGTYVPFTRVKLSGANVAGQLIADGDDD